MNPLYAGSLGRLALGFSTEMRSLPKALCTAAVFAASIASIGCKTTPPTNPAAIKAEPSMLLWGDTHVHGAHAAEGQGIDPHEAYLWAQGVDVTDPRTNTKVKLETPLDFLIVSEDARNMNPASWEHIVEAAEKAYEPCHFTSFIGWEWGTPRGDLDVHRIVIMKQDAQQAEELQPWTSRVDGNPESLWAWLGAVHSRRKTDFIVIPHAGDVANHEIRPMDEEESLTRARWEPVASFGGSPRSGSTPESPREEFARSVLLRGLEIGKEVGVNPFKFGVVGAEGQDGADLAAPGLTAVYAEENTRQAIFAALERKEVYATTGPRMRIRLFGGWNFEGKQANETNMVAMGYRLGHPMGSDLRGRPKDKGPGFLMYAVKDPSGADLDRMQVVKGWVDADGTAHSETYDAIWSGDRQRGEDGTVPPVEGEGAPSLLGFWSDTNFDATQPAFYYLRVLQVPTPSAPAGATESTGGSTSIQERAYTSPIWYTPPKPAPTP
ncbi:MAG: DUF3604 domain-containing protein [Myxococcota bacterium]